MSKALCLSLLSSLILGATASATLAQTQPQSEQTVISKENSLGSLLKSPAFSIFSSLLDQADLLGAMDNERSLTLFVPDNKAFDSLPADMLPRLRQDPAYLRYFLLNHMHPEQMQIDSEQEPVTMSSRVDTDLVISKRSGLAYVNESRVITGNIQADNGVLHIINRPLLPPLRDLSDWNPEMEARP